MKKGLFCFLCIVIFFISATLGSVTANGATRRVSGFYRSDFVKGVAYEGPNHLAIHGYSQSIYEDGSVNQFRLALINDDVIFIHSHGAPGLFTLSLNTQVSGTMISTMSFSSGTKLVYISACKSGQSGTLGNVCDALKNKGVDAVVAFKENVGATTDTNGIHRFNSIVVYKLVNGYTIKEAMELAKKQIYSESEKYWGADSYVIYGDGSVTVN